MKDLPELSLDVHTLSTHMDNQRNVIQTLQQELTRIRLDLASQTTAINNHKEEVKLALLELNKLKNLVATVREEVARNLTLLHKTLASDIDTKYKSFLDLLDEHLNLKSDLDNFKTKVDEIALDAKNAVLKANNSDVHTQLNRKKIENIQLRLQQQELTK